MVYMKVICRVINGLVSVKGETYFSAELAAYHGQKVFVEKRSDYVNIIAMNGWFICNAQKDVFTEK